MLFLVWKFPFCTCTCMLSLFCLLTCCSPALPAGILCASLALGEAGIEMYDLVSSCSLVRSVNYELRCSKGHEFGSQDDVFLKVNLKKSENQSCKRSHKLDGVGVRRIRMFLFLPILFMTPSLMIQ